MQHRRVAAGRPTCANSSPSTEHLSWPHCDDDSDIHATYVNTPPASVLLARGDQQVVVPQARSASGARYVGDGIVFWNKGRDAMVEWQSEKLQCSEAPS